MTFDYARLADPEFFCEHRLPARSDHRWFASEQEAATGHSSFEQCLDGLWKFHFARNLTELPLGFEQPGFDCEAWDDIPVPAHIQMHGYDRPQYCNIQYPWDGYEQIEPGEVPERYNPVGSYVTTFCLDHPLADGEALTVMFAGAESGVAVWLNGVYIGYGADSFTPSEFDLTAALIPGVNKLAAQVFKWTSGSWLEDQDMYRFSGLFRSVTLHRLPKGHAEDVRVETRLTPDCREATIDLWVRSGGSVRASIAGDGIDRRAALGPIERATDAGQWVPPDEEDDPATAHLAIHCDLPRLWSSEDPYLYDLMIEVVDDAGTVAEVIPMRIGLRRFGIEDGVMKINGQRVIFRGVNRHDFGPAGRAMTYEQAEADVRACKAAGINALRTCHYPNGSFFYDLCDEYGLYVIDEMNLETHAMWDRVNRGGITLDEMLPGDRPDWRDVLLDRANNLYQRDKNHTSVIMWSCGNESLGGKNIFDVSEFFREHDALRLVHYEPEHYDPRYPGTSDIASDMYVPADQVEQYLATHRDRPYILCEYAHTMGNSFGAVNKYLDLAERDPLFQGGFIWDFADQAIALTDRHGTSFFGYGGDCGEAPHDFEFCGNGIFFADHTPSPKIPEVRYVYQCLAMTISESQVQVRNAYLFTRSSAYQCVATLASMGKVLATGVIETDVAPGASATYPLPFGLPASPGEYTIDVCFRTRVDTGWAPAGHEVATEQAVFTVPVALGSASSTSLASAGIRTDTICDAPELIEGIHNVGVRGPHFTALFSRVHGGLLSYRYGFTCDGGHELLSAIPMPNFWHAPTSNEKGWHMGFRDGQWAQASRYPRYDSSPDNPSVVAGEDCVEVTYRYTLPTTPTSQSTVSYRVHGNGRIEVTATVTPGDGLPDMPEFGMIFLTDADYHHLRWYGEGPHECYVDRRGGARLGVYSGEVEDQLTPYLRPQEAGSHTGVRWASITNDQGRGLLFERISDGAVGEMPATGGMEFSALPWTPFEIENAAHHSELPPIHHTVVRPALARRGVGGDNSWGHMTHPEYRLPTTPMTFRFTFQGI